jgi:hypothetical protein
MVALGVEQVKLLVENLFSVNDALLVIRIWALNLNARLEISTKFYQLS